MGRDKALVEVEGRPLVLRVAERVLEAADPVFLAPGEPGRLGDLGYPEVADTAPGAGPLAGMAAALRASPHALVAVVAVDLPFASPRLLRMLAGAIGDADALVPVADRGVQPLHAVYRTRCLPAVEESVARGRLAVRALLDRLDVRLVQEDEWRRADPEGRFALNLNRAEDLALLH